MDHLIACPDCGKQLLLPPSAIGEQVRCPGCNATFLAQAPETAITHIPPAPGQTSIRPAPQDPWADLQSPTPLPPRPPLPAVLPGAWQTVATVVLLAISVGHDLLQIVSSNLKLDRLKELAADPFTPSPVDDLFPVFDSFQYFVAVPTVIVFFFWMYRSYKNLVELGVRGLQFSPGWAVGYFFVPILSLYRPCHVAQELWRASAPRAEIDGRAWRNRPPSLIVAGWWTFWLLAAIASTIAFRSGSHPGEIEFTLRAVITTNAFSVLTHLFEMLMVIKIRNRQLAKLEALRSA